MNINETRKNLLVHLHLLPEAVQADVNFLLEKFDETTRKLEFLKRNATIQDRVEDFPHEIWRDVVGYEGLYMVSNMGRVLRILKNRKRLLKRCIDKKGYAYIHLSQKGTIKHCKVSILVAKAFLPNPKNKPVVHHRDRNRANDCVENLEWVTYSENSRYIVKRSKSTKPSWMRSRSKLTPEQVRYIREHYIKGNPEFNAKSLAIKFNVGQTTIYSVIHNKSYKDVS